MNKIIRKTVHIYIEEVFGGLKIWLLVNIMLMVILIWLQIGNILLKVSSNYLLLTWVSINAYYITALFKRTNRLFMLELSGLKDEKRVIFLFLTSLSLNSIWFIFIILQLLISMKANIFMAILEGCLQIYLAILVGILGGVFYKGYKGIGLIIGLGIYNFINTSPLSNDATSHIFSLSEQLYSMNVLNMTHLNNRLILILFIIILLNKITLICQKKLYILTYLLLLLLLIASNLYYDYSQYIMNIDQSFKQVIYKNNTLSYRYFTQTKAEEIADVIYQAEVQFSEIDSSLKYDEYQIDAQYLSQVGWMLTRKQPKQIEDHSDVIELNVLSMGMVCFDDVTLFQSFIEEVVSHFERNTIGYWQSRYSRHMIEGYGYVVKRDVAGELKHVSAVQAEEYYSEYIKKIFEYPVTEYNYIYRIGLIIYDRYPMYRKEVYQTILEIDPQSDIEFADLLSQYFNDVYNDEDVRAIFDKVLN